MPALNYFSTHHIRHIVTVLHGKWLHGWKTKNNNSSTTESELWRNAGPGAF